MKALDLIHADTEVASEKTEYKRIVPGGYVAEIVTVTDRPKGSIPNRPEAGDYLEITFDICEGEYTGYYADMASRTKFWAGKFWRSYKPEALGMFKHFITVLEQSNPSLCWDLMGINNEHDLEGCKLGIILKDDSYTGSDGQVKHRMKVADIKTVSEIRAMTDKKTEAPVVVAKAEDIEDIQEDVPF